MTTEDKLTILKIAAQHAKCFNEIKANYNELIKLVTD